MKKKTITAIRKLMYIILKIVRFPKLREKKYYDMAEINKTYEDKEINITSNNIIIDDSIDLTIIIPVYNAEKLLNKCLNSIINQKTKYKYNVICINDGSVDKSLQILKQYEEKYDFIKIFNQKNKGIAETRNVGIKNINSKYVAFIDSDDYIAENYIEKLLNCAYKNDSDIVRCNYYEYDIDEDKIIKSGKNLESKNIDGSIGRDILTYKGYPWGGIFKSELWNNIQFPEGYWYEDMIIRMILFRKSKRFSYINDKLYYYCIHKNNISKSIEKTSNNKCLDQYYLVKKLVTLSEDLKLQSDESLYCNILYEYGVILWLRTRGINKNLRKMVFIDACKSIASMGFDYCFNKEEQLIYNIFKRQDYTMWNVYAIYKMLGVKYGVE